MIILFLISIIVASVVLGFIVLVQNPKGGGLAGSLAGISNQFMGVKQTTDVLEKGTWVFAAIIGVLCICSAFFLTGTGGSSNSSTIDKGRQAPLPAQTAPATVPPATTLPQNAAPFDSAK